MVAKIWGQKGRGVLAIIVWHRPVVDSCDRRCHSPVHRRGGAARQGQQSSPDDPQQARTQAPVQAALEAPPLAGEVSQEGETTSPVEYV